MTQTNQQSFDVIVVGAGPGGYVAAIRAAQLGLTTAIVEAKHLGGVCLNWGCIPTKALLQSASHYQNIKAASDFGIKVNQVEFYLDKIIARSREIAARLSSGVSHLLKKHQVQVINGFGQLIDANQLLVALEDQTNMILNAKHIILATGARAKQLPNLSSTASNVWHYKQALDPKTMPKSLLVIGSGAIGIEFANFYQALDCEVIVVEALQQIMPNEDQEIAQMAQKQMESRGMTFKLGAKVTQIQNQEDQVTVTIEAKGQTEQITVEKVLSAVGVTPNSENLVSDNRSLSQLGISTDQAGFIETDGYSQTSLPGVYAIGDVAGAPCLAHKASHEAIICVENIAGLEVHPLDKSMVPNCTYGMPQVASIGLTEQQAQAQGLGIKIGRFPYMANGKAIALSKVGGKVGGKAEGLVKTIFDDRTGELLGAHLVGSEATELIHGLAVAKNLETTEEELMHTVFPHPTLSEMLHESVLDAFDRAIHI